MFDPYDPRHDEKKDLAIPRFYRKAVRNKAASAQAGRDVFDEVEFVRILLPSDKHLQVDRPVEPRDRYRWPKQYEAWKNGLEPPMSGSPLAEWPLISRSQAEELAQRGVKTVEQLAEFPDSGMREGDGIRTLKNNARKWLERAQDASVITKAQAEIDTLKADGSKKDDAIRDLNMRLSAMQAQIANAKPRRGRPPKVGEVAA